MCIRDVQPQIDVNIKIRKNGKTNYNQIFNEKDCD